MPFIPSYTGGKIRKIVVPGQPAWTKNFVRPHLQPKKKKKPKKTGCYGKYMSSGYCGIMV
jgi:hypothetical protein